MARQALPRNTESNMSPEQSGRNSDPLRKIAMPHYPGFAIRGGGSPYSFAGLINRRRYPSPYNNCWEDGWIPKETRSAMMNHHKISQVVNNVKNGIAGSGGRSIPAVSPYGRHKDLFPKAVEIMELCDYGLRMMNMSNMLNGDLYTVTKQMLDAITDGTKLANILMRDETSGPYAGARVLDKLTVWDNESFDYWGDEFGNFDEVRVRAGRPEQNRFGRDKFYIFSWRPRNNNPYGTTALRPAYGSYYKDTMIDWEEMAYVAQIGRPSIVIFSSPPPEAMKGMKVAEPLYYSDGSPVMELDMETGEMRHRKGYESEQNWLSFQKFEAGSIWTLNAGAKVEVIEARAGGADMFRLLREQNARNMVAAIAGTHQATESEKSMGQGNGEVGEGIEGRTLQEGRVMVEHAEESQLCRAMVYQNYGPAYYWGIPIRDYGSGLNGRLPKVANALVGIVNGANYDADQWWWICASMGWPLPWPNTVPIQSRMEELRERAKLALKQAEKTAKQAAQNAGGADKSSQGNASGSGDGKTTSGGEQGQSGGAKSNDN